MEGVLNVLKPPGMTSSDVVHDVKRIANVKRAGHLGTLDPGAAGVLPVCLGRATRLFDYLVDKRKEYIGEVRFGVGTDTLDSYGTVVERGEGTVSTQQLEAALPAFVGDILQEAPMYSAVRHGGKRLYELARGGVQVQRPPRQVTVYLLQLLCQTGANRFLFELHCSKGTYVRSLCRDLGAALGVPAHLSFLLRTASGGFGVHDAFSISELADLAQRGQLSSALVTPEAALGGLAAVRFQQRHRRALLHGVPLTQGWGDAPQGQPLRVYADGFLGVGQAQDGVFRMKLWLAEAKDER